MAISTSNVAAAPATIIVSSGDTAITFMSLCNHGATTVLCDIHIIPNGDLSSINNLLITDLEIIAGDTFILYQGGEKILLGNGDYVQVVSDTPNVVSVVTSFVVV